MSLFDWQSGIVLTSISLQSAVTKYTTLGELMGVIKALFGNELEKATTTEATEFVQAGLWPALDRFRTVHTVTEEDGSALAAFAILGVGKHRMPDLVSDQ